MPVCIYLDISRECQFVYLVYDAMKAKNEGRKEKKEGNECLLSQDPCLDRPLVFNKLGSIRRRKKKKKITCICIKKSESIWFPVLCETYSLFGPRCKSFHSPLLGATCFVSLPLRFDLR